MTGSYQNIYFEVKLYTAEAVGAGRVIVLLLPTGMWACAQIWEEHPVQPPLLVTGHNVGFRIHAYKGDAVLGTLVVRINGKWDMAWFVGSGVKAGVSALCQTSHGRPEYRSEPAVPLPSGRSR